MRRASPWSILLGLSLTAGAAEATPIPQLYQDADGQWHAPASSPELVVPYSLPPIESTDVLQEDLSLTVDPVTGATSGELTVVLRAEEANVGSLTLLIDPDLAVGGATVDGSPVTVASQTFGSYRQVQVSFPGLAQGQQATVVVDYAGTLTCSDPNALCDVSPDISVIMQGSAVPHIFDASSLGGYNIWGAPRTLELSLPSGTDAVVPGSLVFDDDDGTTHTRRWAVPGYHSTGGYLVMFGAFDALPVSSSQPPTTVFHASSSPEWGEDMAQWMVDILAFAEDKAGLPLDFETLSAVKLPADWVFPGTAGHGTVYLAESYGNPGADYFEETLAHETAHNWWGVLVSPTDYGQSRWLVEGLATLAQVDFAAIHHAGGLDRQAYLARRYREHAIVMRYLAEPTLPAVLPAVPPAGLDPLQNTYWAYIRSSAALDSLRVLMGEEDFAAALRDYTQQCSKGLCDSVDFQAILEDEGALDLDAAFDAFVRSQAVPAPRISFTQTEQGDGSFAVDVVADNITAPVPLMMIAELDDGTTQRQLLTVAPGAIESFTAPRRVRAVSPDPRHDAVVASRSAQDADIDFDREVDGFDVVRCAPALDTAIGQVADGEGIFLLDLDFDPRCDLDGDGAIGDADLNIILERFGTLTEAP